eukprot:TRINITY_DN40345_c0_g1_i1.p1 TRINITY_DN40345_c0_g1~~TRINITY_DN40345_c0_g1_i1.p1  ORF type:complete len:389 (+),score=101.20 TRINITY_DN40345_c0_g1_i1:488-1654(+)
MVGIGLLKINNMLSQRSAVNRALAFSSWAGVTRARRSSRMGAAQASASYEEVPQFKAQAQLQDLQTMHKNVLHAASRNEDDAVTSLAAQRRETTKVRARLAHMTRMFAGLMLGGDMELRAARRAVHRRLLQVWQMGADLDSMRLRAKMTISEMGRRHQDALSAVRDQANQSIELKDMERADQLNSLTTAQKCQNRELLLVFGIHTLSNMIENAIFRTVHVLFEHWKGFIVMIRYTARLNEVLKVERGALLAAGAHAQDELSDARNDAARFKRQLIEQGETLARATVAAASHEADVAYRKQLQTRIIMLETEVATKDKPPTSVFCQGTLRVLATNTKIFGWVQRWVQLDSDALLFWEEQPQSARTPPSIVVTLEPVSYTHLTLPTKRIV